MDGSIRAITNRRVPAMIRTYVPGADKRTREGRGLERYDRGYLTATPGIIVTRFFYRGQLQPFPVLTHRATGGYIGGPYSSLRTAFKIAGCLGALGDWNEPNHIVLAARIEDYCSRVGPKLWTWFYQVLRPDPKVMELIDAEG